MMKMMSKFLVCGFLLTSFGYAASIDNSSGTVKHRKVFTTTMIGEHLTKEEKEAFKKQKEAKAADFTKTNNNTSLEKNNSFPSAVNEKGNGASVEVDNRSPIEKITGKKTGEDEVNEEKQATNPIVDITRQAPVITKEMRESFKNDPSNEFKP